jgi:hypothetical protein
MFNITGKVVAVGEKQTRGNFDFIEFVLENSRSVGGNTYKDVYAFTIGGKSLDSVMTPEVGDVSDIKFNIRSKEYKEKYYTSLNVYSIEVKEAAPKQSGGKKAAPVTSDDDDLPF